MNSKYKLLVCDVDGTITDKKKCIQTLGIETLRRVQDNGFIVSICSGNVLPVAFGLSTFIGLKGPVIAENGGLVSYKEKIFQLHSDETSKKAFTYLKTKMPEVDRLFTDNWRKTEVALKRSFDLEVVREILKDWNVEIEATGFAIHIMEPGHSKVDGVRKACQILGIDISEVVAIGDSDNDVKMLSQCGYGIAVGNASGSAKDAADFISYAPHSEGVVEGLVHLGMLDPPTENQRSAGPDETGGI
ncbi:MAG: phosphoglycolate phosphatase [Methanomassiliicoccales archaeon]|jgi:phosphoglycolate phosphatase (TIGR01487 family)